MRYILKIELTVFDDRLAMNCERKITTRKMKSIFSHLEKTTRRIIFQGQGVLRVMFCRCLRSMSDILLKLSEPIGHRNLE